MNIELLVDSGEFWARLRTDLADARESAYLQTFSFEGDRVGTALGRRLESCAAKDRRLLVDGYSLLYHNDRVIPGPAWADRSFRREVMLTHRWVDRLRTSGVGVRFGKPIGPTPLALLRRSHKKLAVFDERVAYLGGINFCDHNFAWHDMMLRVEDPDLARHLAEDFRASWSEESLASDRSFGPLRILSLDGRSNPAGFTPVVEAITQAREGIDVVSAYLSPPFTGHLAAAAARGVRVRILTPALNNKPSLARYVRYAAVRYGFEVIRYPGRMNHMKAMIIDDDLLIVGSSNFDGMSYHILEELVVMTRDPAVRAAFRDRVWDPDTAHDPGRAPRRSLGALIGYGQIVAGTKLAAVIPSPRGGARPRLPLAPAIAASAL
jgi:cardiolipin synthase